MVTGIDVFGVEINVVMDIKFAYKIIAIGANVGKIF